MSVIACILFNMVVFLNGSYCLQYYVGIQENTNACICMGTHSQPLLKNRLMDIYQTW